MATVDYWTYDYQKVWNDKISKKKKGTYTHSHKPVENMHNHSYEIVSASSSNPLSEACYHYTNDFIYTGTGQTSTAAAIKTVIHPYYSSVINSGGYKIASPATNPLVNVPDGYIYADGQTITSDKFKDLLKAGELPSKASSKLKPKVSIISDSAQVDQETLGSLEFQIDIDLGCVIVKSKDKNVKDVVTFPLVQKDMGIVEAVKSFTKEKIEDSEEHLMWI